MTPASSPSFSAPAPPPARLLLLLLLLLLLFLLSTFSFLCVNAYKTWFSGSGSGVTVELHSAPAVAMSTDLGRGE